MEEDVKLSRIVEEYLRLVQLGEPPGIDEFAARYPEYPELPKQLMESLHLPVDYFGNDDRTIAAELDHRPVDDMSMGFSTDHVVQSQADNRGDDGHDPNLRVGHMPRRSGKFELIERVGEGGFGQVWKARDTQLGRIVAIKILQRHLCDDPVTRQRFLREAQAVGQLRHPNIVPVYDVAEFDGSPAIVSGFVEGVTLGALMAHRRLDFEEISRLMSDVALAIEYAHSMKLIHRDIKPANIMIDYGGSPNLELKIGQETGVSSTVREASTTTSSDGAQTYRGPRPLVLDFGLALRDDVEQAMTIDGQVLGTPGYMSPEQALGQGHYVDRRSDIYSLGVVLYELLCGKLPFRGAKMSVVHQVIHDEAISPRAIRPDIPGDLETICLKAMAKQPSERYGSANELSMDLRRYLEGEPVSAHPPTLRYRFSKFYTKHKAIVVTTGLLFATLIAGTAGTTRGMLLAMSESVRASSAERLANDRLESLKLERDRAHDAQEEALRQAGVARAVRDFLQNDLLGQANQHHQAKSLIRDPKNPTRLKPDPTIRELLDRFTKKFEVHRNDPRLTDDVRAELLEVLGNTYRGIGEYEQGLELLQQALDAYAKTNPSENPSYFRCMASMGRVHLQLAQPKEGKDYLLQATEGLARLLGDTSDSTLEAESSLAWAYRENGESDRAVAVSEKILQNWKVLSNAPGEVLKALEDLSWALKDVGRLKEAVKISQDITPQMKIVMGEDHPGTMIALHHQSWILWMDGQKEEAVRVNEEALSLRTQALGASHPETLWTMHTLAELLSGSGRHEEAIALAEKTLALRRTVLHDSHPHVSSSLYVLAVCFCEDNQWTKAKEINDELCTRLKENSSTEKSTLKRALEQKLEIAKALGQPINDIEQELSAFTDPT